MPKTRSKRQSGQFVVPGAPLGVIEEFTSGNGTYVEQGRIYAKISGRTLLDLQNKTVSIFPLVHGARVPKVGSIVTGQVLNLQNKTAVIRIFEIGKEQLSGVFSGLLYISDVSRSYVDSIHDACKPGDIVRAKVISEKNRIFHLSTADKNLGVLYALCSQCGHVLQQKRYKVSCPNCGNLEKRQIAIEYGKACV
ncbi:MAG: exosome complex RNA-binding protein Csl4 [Candidatus Bathyarchaeota archaeon]|nr:MAG: exosome complex RNA-binding protein Csl4 [Candidatus Bathyarchaeota archaeon]